MNQIENYLDELATKAASRLCLSELDSLCAETRDHLEASVAARIEFGEDAEVATRNAIEAFGTTSALIREISRRNPYFDPSFVKSLLLVAAAYVGALSLEGISLWVYTLVFVPALFLSIMSFLIATLNARRLQWATFSVGVPLVGLIALLLSGSRLAPDLSITAIGSGFIGLAVLHSGLWLIRRRPGAIRG